MWKVAELGYSWYPFTTARKTSLSDFLMGCEEVKSNPEFLRHVLVRAFGEDIPGVGTWDSV